MRHGMETRYEKQQCSLRIKRIRTFDAIVMTGANRGWKHEGEKKDKREGQSMQHMQNDARDTNTVPQKNQPTGHLGPRIQGISCRQEK